MKYTDLVKVIDDSSYFISLRLKNNLKLANIIFVYEDDENDVGLHCIYEKSGRFNYNQIYLDVYGAGDLKYILSDLENQYAYAQTQNNGIPDFNIERMRDIKKYILKSEINALKSIAKRSVNHVRKNQIWQNVRLQCRCGANG